MMMDHSGHPSGQSLPAAIQALHAAIAEHQDPQAKATLAQCLQNMLKVQAQDMQAASGGGPGGPPAGGPPAGGGNLPVGLASLFGR